MSVSTKAEYKQTLLSSISSHVTEIDKHVQQKSDNIFIEAQLVLVKTGNNSNVNV